MKSYVLRARMPAIVIVLITMLACNMSQAVATTATPSEAPIVPISGEQTTAPVTATAPPTLIPATATVVLTHVLTPSAPGGGKLIYDVESASTAREKRAPYGDSYENNRLERPFLQDMTYVSDLDIKSFTVAKDNDWWYVSIQLVGNDPNNTLGINYGVELDLDHDGFGDYLIWAHPPYGAQWETNPVQIYQDQNHNTGGLSGSRSDAPFEADGYENLIFDGSLGSSDPDLAWVRFSAGTPTTVQFAFKRSWSGSIFMLGVIADAGLKDPGKLDYVDRFPISDAGSPIKENPSYPLNSLFSVDNTCRDAFGFNPTHYEPQSCPVEPTPTRHPSEPVGPTVCPDPGTCQNGWDSMKCQCNPVILY